MIVLSFSENKYDNDDWYHLGIAVHNEDTEHVCDATCLGLLSFLRAEWLPRVKGCRLGLAG